MKLRTLLSTLLLLAALAGRAHPVQAAGPDDIRDYTIVVTPQPDGSLIMDYTINWCVLDNSAGPLTWMTLGMPNEYYEILGASGEAASVQPDNSGFDYLIRIDLAREVNAGECATFGAHVHQYALAGLDGTGGQIGFHFTPGWFNEAPVDHLRVTWQLPQDAAQVLSFNPNPTSQAGGLASWETSLQPGEKYPIAVVYASAAFPEFDPNLTGPATSTSTLPTADFGDQGAGTQWDWGENGSSVVLPVVGGTLSVTTCVCLCVIALIVLVILFALLRMGGWAARTYRGGGWIGGYPGRLGGGTIFRPSSGGGGFSFPSRSGGGSGQFGGRGSSCACVSSGCACACAGGGRAGCSRKGFDVSGLVNRPRPKGQA